MPPLPQPQGGILMELIVASLVGTFLLLFVSFIPFIESGR